THRERTGLRHSTGAADQEFAAVVVFQVQEVGGRTGTAVGLVDAEVGAPVGRTVATADRVADANQRAGRAIGRSTGDRQLVAAGTGEGDVALEAGRTRHRQ